MILLLSTLATAQDPSLSSGTFSVAADPRETVEQTRLEERGILDALSDIDTELQSVSAEVEGLRVRKAELEARQLQTREELAAADAQLDHHRAEVASWMRLLYRLHRRGLARIIFSSEDPYDLRRRSRYLAAIISADAQRLVAFSEAVETRRTAETAVSSGMDALNSLGAELQLKEGELQDQRSRKLTLLQDVRTRRELAMRLMSETTQARSSFNTQLSMGGGWYTDSGTTSGSRCGDSGAFRSQNGRLPWPISGRLIRRFGSYTDARSGRSERSDGVDIAAELGTPVKVVYGGAVRIAESLPMYGQTVAVAHGPYTTVYAHLSGIKVRVGQQLCAGDVLGTVGGSGLTDNDGYLLSFQVRYHDEPQDPLPWLTRGGY
ncbi:MAG: septal ring factor EnvC (AmiA/AmiB activator) [Myxococcota bacterium]|jgi:septal ring factor EnvC (AmiA/AmiB activator)